MAKSVPAVALTCAVAMATPAVVATLQDQQQRPQFRGGTDLVRLDVSVLDGDGRPVSGLTADDFTIHDNGRDYTPSFFEAIEIPLVLEADASWQSRVVSDVTSNEISDEGRLIVIVLDDSALPGRSSRPLDESRAIAHSVIDHLAPTDLAAVVFTLNGSDAQGFTNDKGRLRRAVDGLGAGFTGLNSFGEFRNTEVHFERGSIRTLDFIAEKLMEAPGRRKALVYVSGGVPPNDDSLGDMQALFKRAQHANVAVYSFNPFGMLAPGTWELDRAPQRFAMLRTVASNTGGFAVVDTNEPVLEVARVFEENSAYYLIGYEPVDPPEPGGFRTVDVTVNRRGVDVRTRRGYYTPEEDDDRDDLTPEERTLRDAVGGLLPVSEMPMRVQVAPFPVAGRDDAAVIVTAEVRQPAPEELTEHTVRVTITAYDQRGRVQAETERASTVLMAPSDREIRVEMVSRLDLDPGRYEIRLASHNPDMNLTGSVFQDVEVPDFRDGGVRLSGVLIATPAPAFSRTDQQDPPDEVSEIVPVTPTTVREFRQGDRATVFARVHQGGRRALQDVELTVSILTGDGTAVIDRTGTLAAGLFEDDRQTDLNMELPLPAFEPGEYLMTISIAGSDDDAAVRQVRFTVR